MNQSSRQKFIAGMLMCVLVWTSLGQRPVAAEESLLAETEAELESDASADTEPVEEAVETDEAIEILSESEAESEIEFETSAEETDSGSSAVLGGEESIMGETEEHLTDGEGARLEENSSSTASSTIMWESSATSTPATSTASSSGEVLETAEESPVTIATGHSVALLNILNLVNSNFINSEGIVLFKNFLDVLTDDLDLRTAYGNGGGACSLGGCISDEIHTNIKNDAIIENELYVEAVTGRNTQEGNEHAVTLTGNAYAGVNLVNVANTNIIDSNYLLLTMNAFNDVNGDIVFPSLHTFFNDLARSAQVGSLGIQNSGEIENNLRMDAISGNNTVSGAGESEITTGRSTAATNIFNQLNTSLLGGESVSIILKVHGSWAGEIFGAPEGLAWMEDGRGGIYLFNKNGRGESADTLHVHATNTARIKNNIEVVALTGENAISGAETALISTGDAYAGANIMNVANATVVGRNWILAIVNIMGDFNGDIAFGRPDLWVGGQVEVPGRIENGSDLSYKLTVLNNGDSVASDVRLSMRRDAGLLSLKNASLPYTVDEEGSVIWELPDLAPGGAIELTYVGTVQNAGYNTDINTFITVEARETDNNDEDNNDIVTVTTSARRNGGGSNIRLTPAGAEEQAAAVVVAERPVLIERVSSTTNVHLNTDDSVTQIIRITNNSDKRVEGVVLRDLLTSPSNAPIHEEVWEIGALGPHEIIEISYDVYFNRAAPRGVYGLSTQVGWNGGSQQFGKNGTILVWESEPISGNTKVLATGTPIVQTRPFEEPESPSNNSFWGVLFPKAEAAEEIDIRNTHDEHLAMQLRVGGMLMLLAALLMLYFWYRSGRRTWYEDFKRDVLSG